MNIENLKNEWLKDNNKEFKYKEMCSLLAEEEKKSGKSRNYQFKDWKRYFDFYKPNPKGQKIIITEFYKQVVEKIDNRGKNKNSHKHSTSSYEELEYILLDCINKYKKCTIYVTNNILATQTITNNNYYFAMKNQKYFNVYMKKLDKLSNNTITKDLFSNISTSCKGIIQTSLEKLHKKYGLKYDYNYILIERVEDEGNIIDETRSATTEEIKTIDITTKNYISKFNTKNSKKIKKLNDVNYLKQELYREFYDGLDIEVFESLHKHDSTEIKMYFKGYIIEPLENIAEILNDIDIKQLKEKLNKKFIENSTNNIIRQIQRKEKIINEYIEDKIEKGNVWGLLEDEEDRYKKAKNKFNYREILMIRDKYKKEYIDILNFILDDKTKDLRMEIENIKYYTGNY